MIALIVFSLCLVTLTSASSHPWLSSPDEDDPVLLKCYKDYQKQIHECGKDITAQVNKHMEDIDKHRSDPENVSETTKKDVCCSEWKAEDCALNAMKAEPKCIEAYKKFFETDQNKRPKMCGVKYARGGEGCKQS
jgi:hypothetical protein